MKIIGISGPIGSGKSTFANIARTLGYPVFVSDDVSNALLDSNENKQIISTWWGETMLLPDGKPNRTAIANLVFSSAEELAKLNALLHPQVLKAFDDFVSANVHHPFVFRESALLLPQVTAQTHLMLAVLAPEKEMIKRVFARSGITEAEYRKRRLRQPSIKEYIKHADVIVINASSYSLLEQFEVILDNNK
ncbi:MAG: dephospho-CoA kinase [Bacteroidota bacterium]|jgi:dephospho-CoA kinase